MRIGQSGLKIKFQQIKMLINYLLYHLITTFDKVC